LARGNRVILSQPRVLTLAGQGLGNDRHVCALFDGPDVARGILRDFVREGLEQGDWIIHVVEEPASYLRSVADDVALTTAAESGQLDVRSWNEAYLADGRFSGSRMLGYVRRSLQEGAARGYAATRLIGEMEWARDDVPGVNELEAYESEVDSILGRPPHAVICSYDVRRHSGSRIAAIVGVHQAALVGGKLRRSTAASERRTPRDRILDAASQLFSANGIRSTGVDALIKKATVAKATFYRHFPSKDRLIVAWLEDPRTRWFDRVRAVAEARASSPAALIAELFSAVVEWLEAGDFEGCPYLNSAFEILDQEHPAVPIIRDYLAEIEHYLQAAASAAGVRDSDRVGTQIHALLAGSISLGVAHRTSSFALAARDAATALVADGQRQASAIHKLTSRRSD
jgi:AcrR family transcriptional regulator